jgi:hypothetical protein
MPTRAPRQLTPSHVALRARGECGEEGYECRAHAICELINAADPEIGAQFFSKPVASDPSKPVASDPSSNLASEPVSQLGDRFIDDTNARTRIDKAKRKIPRPAS